MNQTPQPGKDEVIRLLLEHEGRVMLCLDATRPGVSVPRRFAKDPGLRLILNSRMPQPIEIGADSVESELRFGGIPHYCVIPFDALWGVFNPDTGHGMFWADSMPPAVRGEFEQAQESWPQSLPLTLLENARASAPESAPKAIHRAPAPRPRRPQLQVIAGGAEGVVPAAAAVPEPVSSAENEAQAPPSSDDAPPPPESPPPARRTFLRVIK
ncbi:MAG: hypothetical protein HQL51_16720 [Magnetococcales bacterium]|nr:hypothetical protein [Magnetococcales bacterium]